MSGPDYKPKRVRERIKLALPVRVRFRESAGHEWTQMSRLVDVTPFGARFTLTRLTEPGRLLHLMLAMPRQLRCFDHVEDQYRVWALVRHVTPRTQAGGAGGQPTTVYDTGVAFTGKNPPASYVSDPATIYQVETVSDEGNLWKVRPRTAADAWGERRGRHTRFKMALPVRVEVFDPEGRLTGSEETVTENISRRGAAVWTTLKVERGRFVLLTSTETGLSVVAAVRTARTGPDNIPRLHLEFIDKQWPLEGIE